jgi:hypothetical protein
MKSRHTASRLNRAWLAMSALLYTLGAGAAQPPVGLARTSVETLGMSLPAFCEANACRQNTRIVLRTGQDTLDAKLDMFWPVLHDGVIHVLPGEKLYLEVDWDGNSLRNIRQVPAIADATRTLTIEFLQREAALDMIMQIRNPFAFAIKLHADMGNFDGGVTQTSTCPVRPGMIAIEQWPHPITQMILSGLRRLPDDSPGTCEY